MRYRGDKKQVFKIILGIIFLFLAFHISPALADTSKDLTTQKLKQEITVLEETIKNLSDEKIRKELISDLENLLAAKKEILVQKSTLVHEKSPKKETFNLIHLYGTIIQRLETRFDNLKDRWSQLPAGWNQIKLFFSKKENLNILLNIGLKLMIVVIISAFFLFLMRGLTRKWKASYKKKKTFSPLGKIKTLLFDVFLESYYLAILFFLSWLFLGFFFRELLASAILYTFGAWIIYRVSKGFLRLLLSPDDPGDRLFPMDEQLVSYIIIWSYRVLLFSLWMFILTKISSLFGFEHFSVVFKIIYRVGLLIMLAIILAQWKEGIQKLLTLSIKEGETPWKTKGKNMYNRLVGGMYLALIIYFSVIVLMYVLGYRKTSQFFLYATLKSVLALGLAALVWFLWENLFRRLFAISKDIKESYPTLEKQVNQYINWIGKLAHFFIILFALIFLLSIWGFDLSGFLSSYFGYISRLIRIPIIILTAIILIQMINFLIEKTIKGLGAARILKEGTAPLEVEKQMTTLGGILRKSLFVAVWLIAGMMILKEMGFSIGPILAGAGIVGLAVGFGAQNLVRDVISGLFMIIENQVRVGDVAILNGTGGLVEKVNLRTTVLRGLDATVHIFPNGSINSVSNMTHDFSFYVFDIGVAYKEDVDRVCSVLMEIGDQIIQEDPYKSAILEPLEILGLDKFGDSAIIIKARIKTQPIKQWMVGREMNRRIKKRFDEEGIEIPFPHRTFYFGEVSKPIDVNVAGWERYSDEIKGFIRKVINETLRE